MVNNAKIYTDDEKFFGLLDIIYRYGYKTDSETVIKDVKILAEVIKDYAAKIKEAERSES